ncbi:MAG: preprotein translocase subunit SecY [Clostridia bacterium]|nr:preprotein translocase subunit SecY [Clostridia bacterium]
MGSMFETLRNALKIRDLRKKVLFTIAMLLVFRIGSHIPVPGMDPTAIENMFKQGALFGFLDIVSGGAFKGLTIFAMSITPYINASIIMQLLTIAIPRLEQLSKEGEEGRKIIGQYIRYGTVVLGFMQAVGYYVGLKGAVLDRGVLSFFTITLTFTAGTAFLMWLGEQITEYGIGNGISIIIFAGIVSRAPSGLQALQTTYVNASSKYSPLIAVLQIVLIVAVFIAIVAAVVWVSQAERRIPVQYAKRVVGRKMYGGQSTHIPIKVNLAGVIPIIFAMSIMMFPSTVVGIFAGNSSGAIATFFKNWPQHISYSIVNALLVMFFTFFYTVIVFNPIEVANTMKKNGGFIPGIRPGKPTSDYIAKVLNRITWFGALFLALVTILPSLLQYFTNMQNVWFGGTAVLILVGVAMDTVKQIESQMLMRHYKGFLE